MSLSTMRKTSPSLWLLPHDPVTTHKDMQGVLSMPQRLSLEQSPGGEPAPEEGQPEPDGARRNESALCVDRRGHCPPSSTSTRQCIHSTLVSGSLTLLKSSEVSSSLKQSEPELQTRSRLCFGPMFHLLTTQCLSPGYLLASLADPVFWWKKELNSPDEGPATQAGEALGCAVGISP